MNFRVRDIEGEGIGGNRYFAIIWVRDNVSNDIDGKDIAGKPNYGQGTLANQ